MTQNAAKVYNMELSTLIPVLLAGAGLALDVS